MNKLSAHLGNPLVCAQFFSNMEEVDLDSRLQHLADRINEIIKGRGLSRYEFANMMNVQPSIVTRWLSGKHNFTITTLFAIEHTLGINLFDKCNHPTYSYSSFRLTVYSPVTTLPNSSELMGALNLMQSNHGSESVDSRINIGIGCTHTRAYLHTPTIHINKFISDQGNDK